MNGENKNLESLLMDIQASKYSGTSGQRSSEVMCKGDSLTVYPGLGSFDEEFEISSLVNF